MTDEPDREDGGWYPEGEPEHPDNGSGRGRRGGGDAERKPPRGLASADAPKRASRYSLFVGLAFTAIVVIALLNLIRNNDDSGILGIRDDEGAPLAEFAVPDARGTLDGDANVFQDDCESSENPCPADDLRTPACEIETAGAIRVCDFFDKPLAISFWFTRGGDCTPTQDAFDDAARRLGDQANFLSVNVRDSRETVTDIIDESGWQVPVTLDPDGAVSNLYRVGGCPSLVLAYPGGIFYRSKLAYEPDQVQGFVEDLIAASRRRAATSR